MLRVRFTLRDMLPVLSAASPPMISPPMPLCRHYFRRRRRHDAAFMRCAMPPMLSAAAATISTPSAFRQLTAMIDADAFSVFAADACFPLLMPPMPPAA